MFSRRKFLGATALTAGSIATSCLAKTLPLVNLNGPPPECFDITTAKEIVSETSALISKPIIRDVWVDLTGFAAYTQDALDYLVDNIRAFEGIEFGFRYLTQDGARALTRLRVDFCCLNKLARLDEPVATILGQWDLKTRPIRAIGVQELLSPDAAFALVASPNALSDDTCDSPLDLSIPTITADLAQALRLQPHELYLHIADGALPPDAATALAHHVGYSLSMRLKKEPPDESMAALMSNPRKRVERFPDESSIRIEVTESLSLWSLESDITPLVSA